MTIFGKRRRVDGLIRFYELEDWWFDTFSDEERDLIESSYDPLGDGTNPLTHGKVTAADTRSLTQSLLEAARRLPSHSPIDLRERLWRQAEQFAHNTHDPLTLHFLYQDAMLAYYNARDERPDALDRSWEFVMKQVKLAPRAADAYRSAYPGQPLPTHIGYKRLCSVYEKQGRPDMALTYAQSARDQGWASRADWVQRIATYEDRIAKGDFKPQSSGEQLRATGTSAS